MSKKNNLQEEIKELKKQLEKKNRKTQIITILIVSAITLILNHIPISAENSYNSNEVSYDNTNSTGLTSPNVQGALDGLYQAATDYSELRSRIQNIEDKLYPVGSIYISMTDDTVAKVQQKLGGTWEVFGSGRTLIGMGSNGTTNYSTIGATGGSESQSYTPAGSNSGGSVTGGNITYTPAGTNSGGSVTGGNITYTPAGSNSGMGVTMNQVTLSHSGGAVQATTLTVDQIPSHTHPFKYSYDKTSTYSGGTSSFALSSRTGTSYTSTSGNNVTATGGGKSHTHGFTQPSQHTFTPTAKSYTQPTFTGTKATLTHTHTVTQPTFTGTQATLTHSHTVTQPTFTGTAATISHMQPYITVYMYRRLS